MKDPRCPICNAKLPNGKERDMEGKKYLFIRCLMCYYEDRYLLHKPIIIKKKKKEIYF